MIYYDLDDDSGVCPCCGNHFGYGVVIDGMCEECYIQKYSELGRPEPECEEWEYYGFNSKEEFEKWRREKEWEYFGFETKEEFGKWRCENG